MLRDKLLNAVSTKAGVAVGVITVYISLCRALRFRRRDQEYAKYPYKTREDMAKMTTEHAWEIVRYITTLEFPLMAEKALQFALFRTYAIPTISKLLCETRQLAEPQNAPRRYEDTTVLITEFINHPPSSSRANAAIARMNYLHGLYQPSGKISNDDMLYTLSLFILEVERWIRLYEWRQLTDMELCALSTFWKSIGDAQGIDFSPLPNGPSSFRDGLDFFHSLRIWADQYEERCMIPTEDNHKTAEETTSILVYNLPRFLQPVGRRAVIALMDERLRIAMMYPRVSSLYYYLVPGTLHLRRFVLSFLTPPRPEFLRVQTISATADPQTGRYHKTAYEVEPWYIANTFWNRNKPSSWLKWLTGRPYPGCKGGEVYKSEGYRISEIGPTKWEKSGQEECEELAQRLQAGRVACPFAVR
ncbi:uncharacterized protein EI97DRAFT_426019 [Westerdykella ornata]|uniref:Uncharacterized protein n=1 Tax=Westerdykella ornata TaxID=318751 RepID=A0A6A6JAA2_WESOR|nr:uncharacterized protein EI97DRAFT_426019 [Westerdykella ornata]KAF2272556.1 hypothetical protein EI97DRAFT_426019 [Westerdykella ornata]